MLVPTLPPCIATVQTSERGGHNAATQRCSAQVLFNLHLADCICLQVGRWIAIACPFGGAPGYATDGLITGMQFGGYLGDTFFVKR